jgi:hypothetical protein
VDWNNASSLHIVIEADRQGVNAALVAPHSPNQH